MRVRLTALLFLAGALAFPVSSLAARGELRVTEVARVRFPDRAFVLTASKPLRLDRSRVRVFENGKQVRDFSLVPARRAGRRMFGVVLVVDASLSMRGKPIVGALSAARAFAARRAPNQLLGLITFNRRLRVALPLTTDPRAIRGALASRPALREGTHLYDAVARAIALLRRARIAAGSVVLLSDGRDTGSRLRERQLAARARAAHVRVFAVGLRSRQFSPSVLRAIAGDTRAVYSEASSPADLARIYGALGAKLANEHLIQYRSLLGPAKPVRVEVRVAGVRDVAVATYRTPALPSGPLEPYHRSLLDRFWASPAAMLVVSLAAALLAALAIAIVLRRGQSTLRRRMADFVSVEQPAAKRREARLLTGGLLAVERALARTPRWQRFKEELEIAEIPIPAVHLVLATTALSVFAGWLFSLILPLFGLFGLGVPLVVNALIKRKLARRRYLFAEQLPENLTVLASALRAGHSFVGAVSVAINEAEEPARSELGRAVADEQLGVPIEDALREVARRMANADLEQVALVAALQRQTGGNTAEVLDTVAETIRQRFELHRLVRTLTAQGRMARWIVTSLPAFLAALITLINPGYLKPLYTTTPGQAALVIAVLMVIAGSFWIKRIVDIKV